MATYTQKTKASSRKVVSTSKRAPAQKSKWDRSDGYRTEFLKYNPGLFGCLYFCVYCGKPITRKNMQVDHHIAINLVRHNPLLKLFFGIGNVFSNIFGKLLYGKSWTTNKGVNVTYNLLPACPRCNHKKLDKGGFWIIRGMIGGTSWRTVNLVNTLFIKLFSTPLGPILALTATVVFLVIPH